MVATTVGQQEGQYKLVLLAIWVIYFLVNGITKAIGVMLPLLLDQLDASSRTMGIAVSLVLFTGYVTGKCFPLVCFNNQL